MKKVTKLIAALLAVVMLLGAIPMCFAENDVPPGSGIITPGESTVLTLPEPWVKDFTLSDGNHHASIQSLSLVRIEDAEVYDIFPCPDERAGLNNWDYLSKSQQNAITSVLANQELHLKNTGIAIGAIGSRRATQIIIWEFVTGIRNSDTFVRTDASLYNAFLAVMNDAEKAGFISAYTQMEYLLYITDIINAIATEGDIHFNVEHDVNTDEYTLIFEDTQNTLADYNMERIQSLANILGMKYSFDNGILKITTTKEVMNAFLSFKEVAGQLIRIPSIRNNSITRYGMTIGNTSWVSINTPVKYVNIFINIYDVDQEGVALPFVDVSEDAWYYDTIKEVYARGLFGGVSATKFSPESAMTRAMLVTVLYRLDGEPDVNSQNTFTDVPDGIWYADAVKWAAERNIVNGVGGNKFKPDADITREQVATILYRFAEYKAKPTPTVKHLSLADMEDGDQVSAWAVEAMNWCMARSIIRGSTQNGKRYVFPQDSATRAEVAAMLLRLENVSQ